ncbi:MAG: preprotein translocase subunit YajC [Clostridia bacterium]|nr:preprotein translocase subunit YajC [Clostridia bacterium]MDY5264685.1 preprotein translocase subunit YajC [Eubacteriales bacterium]MDY5439697.1 preprotein translocase subunit YajC [Eubacteriales bacterium]
MNNLIFLAEEAQGGFPAWAMWVILGVAFVLMIAMTIIPRRKQQKQTQNMMDNLKVGDKVMTIGRIVGVITAIDNSTNTVTIQSGEGEHASILVIDKLAIGMVINSNAPQPKQEVKQEEKKEEEVVIEKTAKENKVADMLKKHKKNAKEGAFDEAIEAETVVTETESEVVTEEVSEAVEAEATVEATEEVQAEEVKEEK